MGRSIRYKGEQETTYLCLSPKRQRSLGNRCAGDMLEESGSIRLSSNTLTGGSSEEDKEGALLDHTCSPLLGEPSLVPRTVGSSNSSSLETSALAQASETTSVEPLPPQPRCLQASRLETIITALKCKGFNQETARRIAGPQRDSSLRVYQSRWVKFVSWCDEQNLVPLNITEPQMAEFMLYLSDTYNFSYPTLLGYLTAISSAIQSSSGSSFACSKNLQNLIRNLFKDKIVKVREITWDLALVLNALKKAPFEPLDSCHLRYLTYKTVFLLTLAAGSRRGEVSALLQKGIKHDVKWTWVELKTDDAFLFKNQRPHHSNFNRCVKISSLIQSVGPLEEKLLLCPVRALRMYLARTSEFRKDRKRLFVPMVKGLTTELHKNTISSWIKKCVKEAYLATPESSLPAGIKAHDVRGLSASWAFHKTGSMESLMNSCKWRSQNCFIKYYLKDCTAMEDDMCSLGPVIVTGVAV